MLDKDGIFVEKFYDAIFDNSPLGIIHYNNQGIITACNSQIAQIIGVSKEKLVGFNIFKSATNTVFLQAIKNSLEHSFGKMEGSYTSVISHKTSHVYSLFFGIKNNLGEIEKGIGIIQDVSAIKNIQEAFYKNQTILQNIMHSIPDLIWAKDTQGKYLTCSKRFEALVGLKESEIIGKNDYDFFDKNTADAFLKYDKKVIQMNAPCINEENLIFADNHEEMSETLKSPLYDEKKNIIGVLGLARDITERKRLLEALELNKFSIDNANMPIYWINHLDSSIFYANKAACDSLGYSFDELTQLSVIHIDPNFTVPIWDKHSKKLYEEKELHFETRHIKKDGTVFPVEIFAKILNFNGKVYNIAFSIDMTETKKAQESLKQSEKLLRESQTVANIGSWEYNFQTQKFIFSDQAYHILGLNKKEVALTKAPLMNCVHPEDADDVSNAFNLSLQTKEPFESIYRIINDQKTLFVHVQCKTEFLVDVPLRTIGTVRDVTHEHNLSQKVEYFTNYDNLTNLPNRFFFSSKLKQLIDNTQESHQPFIAVCFIDLDNFKYINDTYGHSIGDEILREFSTRLHDIVEPKGWIARFGGDAFTAVLEHIKKPSDAATLAEHILKMMRKPFVIAGEHHQISVSIGISLYPNDTKNAQDLITYADTAMHRAKESGKNRYEFYTHELTQAMTKKMQLLTLLDEALVKEQFELYYQPQIELNTKKVIGFEALIRWNHPTRGLISPVEFIPIAEESKFIIPLGKWILKTACLQAKEWRKEGLFKGVMAVNVSGIQLDEPNFAQSVEAILKEVKFNPSYLEIEITESSLMSNSQSSLKQLKKLNALKIRLAIDDFGTGYSSLAYLRKMPVSTLKIDQSFIKDLPKHKDACAVVETILALATTMKKDALAEGIETEKQLRYLEKINCKNAQGYFFAKPLCKSDAKAYLLKQLY
ncbi:MAG: EAL domain-containing protein [Sulfurospirillaceae bacterium]|nr:EAL domain-containing protein [Sulfurospirillaceae bacterium]